MISYIGSANTLDPLAQTVEHLTFNQGVRSSSLRWVTKKIKAQALLELLFFIQAAGLVWHQCACALYEIAKGGWHHAQACIFVFLRLDHIQLCELISCATSLQFHSSLRDDHIHGFAVIQTRWCGVNKGAVSNLHLRQPFIVIHR